MANLRITELEKLRTRIWAEGCMVSAGTSTPVALEKKFDLLRGVVWDGPKNVWRRHLKGTRRPYSSRTPFPKDSLVDLAEEIWPFTAEAFYTPAWYLLEDQNSTLQELLDCAFVLPHTYREHFVREDFVLSVPGLRLKEVFFETVFDVSATICPWSLGALAVTLRRAEHAGDLPVYKNAVAGTLWMVQRLSEQVNGNRRYLYQRLRRVLIATFLPKLTLSGDGKMQRRLLDAKGMQCFEERRLRYLTQQRKPFDFFRATEAAEQMHQSAMERLKRLYGGEV